MSVAINLLPDVRLARIRAQHIRHLITGIAVAVWIIVGIIVGGLLIAIGSQKLIINNVNTQIASDTSQIEGISGLNNALTSQQILTNLPALYASRTYYSKFMPVITAAMPTTVSVTAVSSSSLRTLSITGSGNSAYAVDQFYEALKASGVSSPGGANFSGVTIAAINKDPTTGADSFTLSAVVAPGVTSGQN